MRPVLNLLRWPLILTGGLLGMLALALVGGYLFLQTDGGRDWLGRQLVEALSVPGELEISLGRLGGQIPQDIELEDLSIRDAEGEWLSLTSLRLAWRPLALLGRRLEISDLEARQLTLARLPEQAPSEQETDGGGLPSLPFAVRLERADIEEVRLGAPVLGQAVAFDLKGEATGREDGSIEADFALTRRDGPTGSARFMAKFQPKDRQLTLDAAIAEDRGGLIGLLLERPGLPPLRAKLAGDGPIGDWQGSLTGDVEDTGALEAKVHLTEAEDLTLATQGKLTLAQLPEEPIGALLAGGVSFEVTGRWDGGDQVAVERAALATAALELDLSGKVDLSSLALNAKAQAKALDDRAISALLDGVEVTGLTLAVTADGPALEPALAFTASATRLVQGDIRAKDLSLEATFQPDSPLDQGLPAGALTAKAQVASLALEPTGEVAALIGKRFDMTLDGRLDLPKSLASATRLTLQGEQIAADGSFRMNLDDGSGDGDLTAIIASLSPLSGLLGMTVGGRLDLDSAKLRLRDYGSDLAIDLTGRLNDVTIEEAIAQALLAGEQQLAAKIHVLPDQLTISDLTLKGPNGDLSGDLTLSQDFEQLNSAYQLALPNAAILSEPLSLNLKGYAKIEGEAIGKIENPSLNGRLVLTDALVEGQPLGRVDVAFTAHDLAELPNGHVDLSAAPTLGPATGAGDYRLDGETLKLTDLKLNGLGTAVSGQAAIPVSGGPMTAELKASAKSLAPLLAAADLGGDGAAQLEAKLSPDGANQAARVTGKVTELTLDLEGTQLAARSIDGTLDLKDLFATPAGTLQIESERLSYDAMTLATARLTADGSLDAATFELNGTGLSEQDPTLSAAGKIDRAGDKLTLELARFTGALSGQKLALRAPSTIGLADGEISVDRLDLDLGTARLTAEGRIDRASLDAKLELSEFQLGDLEPVMPNVPTGQVSAKLDLAGPLDALEGTIGLTGRTIKLLDSEDSQTLDFDLDGALSRGELDLTGGLDTGVGQDAAITGKLPIAIDPESFKVEVPPRRPLSATLNWAGDVAEIWDVFGLAGHDLAGDGKMDIKVAGTLDDPDVQGQVTITRGYYENFQAGTVFKDLEAELNFSGEQAVLSKLSASDGGNGRLSAQGSVELEPDQSFPLSLIASLDKAVLVRRDDVTASAGGKLTLAGNLQKARLEGEITTDRVEVSVAQSLPPQVVDLHVEMVNFPELDMAAAEQRKAAVPFDLGLELAVNMPRRVYVRGNGLETEWSGNLDVKGTAEKPEVIGKMTLVRGTVNVIGKQFRFDRGEISFDGGAKIDPLIDIIATSRSKDITVTVAVTGTATDPKIEMTSSPEVPQDEMIARLLFNKSASELSSFELIQVGAAVAQLTGAGGGGAGIFDTTRNLIGVDVLRLDSTQNTDGTTDPALSVGKYVSDGVYLGVKQGAVKNSSSVTVDVDLTDNISVESDVTEAGDSNIGIRFEWDY